MSFDGEFKGPALNKGEAGEITQKKFRVGSKMEKDVFFLGTEKEEGLAELVNIEVFICI